MLKCSMPLIFKSCVVWLSMIVVVYCVWGREKEKENERERERERESDGSNRLIIERYC